MPELPEVETVRRGLEPVMAGRRFLSVDARRPDLRFPLPDRFVERLTGTRVEAVSRRGKHLVAPLGSGETLVMHLGMSGRFTIATSPSADARPGAFAHARGVDPKHDHVVFALEGDARVTFNDPRRFGFMELIAAGERDAHPALARMGPEPLSDAFDTAALVGALDGKRTSIKAALLDQRVVAGLGNIYVCEALFRAGLSPRREARTIAGARADRLVRAIRGVLIDAIEAGGSSLRDYANAEGGLGYFQHAFDVYGREGEACRRRGCPGEVRRLVQSGRSTFHCPKCQR